MIKIIRNSDMKNIHKIFIILNYITRKFKHFIPIFLKTKIIINEDILLMPYYNKDKSCPQERMKRF